MDARRAIRRGLILAGTVAQKPYGMKKRLRAGIACLIFFGVAGCSVPSGIDRRGSFQIESYTTDAFGHIGTRRALYHVNGAGRRTKVTDAALAFQIAPRDPNRIVYETCGSNSGSSRYGDDSACAHMYFDGQAGKTYTIGRGLKISMSQLDESDRWSSNGRSVALGDQYELVLVDLQTGRSTRLTRELQLEEPHYPEKWQHREGRWGAWSPNGEHAALLVRSPHEAGLPVREWDEELYAIAAATGALTLVPRTLESSA